MRKLVKVTGSMLCLFLALCAYWAANTPELKENSGYAGNAFYRVRVPCTPHCDQQKLDALLKEVGQESQVVTIRTTKRQ